MEGAIDTTTNQYVLPQFASKDGKYRCLDPECRHGVFLRSGQIRRPHFAHQPAKDGEIKCGRHSGTGESDQHKEAKYIISHLLKSNQPVEITRAFQCCKKTEKFIITDASNVQMEKRISTGIADVACTWNGQETVIEILNTHRTREQNRTGMWFELKASAVLEQGVLECWRRITCAPCEEKSRLAHEEWVRNQIERERCRRLQELEDARISDELARISHEEKIKTEFEISQKQQAIVERTKEAERLRFIENEARRLARAEEHKIEQENLAAQRAARRLVEDQERIAQKLAQEQQEKQYQETYELYIREIVEPYVYRPFQKPDSNNVMFHGHDFLHPHHVHRMRHLKLKK